MDRQEDSFEQAKSLLYGALDTVISLGTSRDQDQGSSPYPRGHPLTASLQAGTSRGQQSLDQGPSSSSSRGHPFTASLVRERQQSDQGPSSSSGGYPFTASLVRERKKSDPQGPSSSSRGNPLMASSTPAVPNQLPPGRPVSSLEEHRRLFGFHPSKSQRRKGRARGGLRGGSKKPSKSTWHKDCICLRDKEQSWRPSPEEKIELARMGLGLKDVIFRVDGNAEHIHQVILEKFPVLEQSGGYTLMRLAENSHSMVEIESPDSGMSVSFLKDILNQAKLYIRPLQKDITEEDMKPFAVPEDEVIEPQEFCQVCDSLLPLSQLRKHVVTCKKPENRRGQQQSLAASIAGNRRGDSREEDGGSSLLDSAPKRPRQCHPTRRDDSCEQGGDSSLLDFAPKRPRQSQPTRCDDSSSGGSSLLESAAQQCQPHGLDMTSTPLLDPEPHPEVRDPPSSPLSPSPEPLSPFIEPRVYAHATYESFINLISDDELEWQQDPDVQLILQESIDKDSVGTSNQLTTLEDVLQDHKKKVLYEDIQKTFRITVRRGHIFDDTLAMLRFGFDERKHLRVTFLGEAAVDEGGPRREFFMVLMGAISNNSSLLDGPADRRVLRHNISAFQDEQYLYVGRMIALSVLHGGPGPVFFSPVVVDYLFGGVPLVKPTIDDVPDKTLQGKIQKLSDAPDEKEFKDLLSSDEYDFRYACGLSKPVRRIPFADKEKVISAMCLHYSMLVSLAELEQMRRGLAVQKFQSLMDAHPALMRKAFTPSKFEITSDYIQDLFLPNFSQDGTNKRQIEEGIMMMWLRYLQSIEFQGDQGSPNLKDVMVFLTGCDSPPPMGFGRAKGAVTFFAVEDDEDDGRLPTASTCSLTLRFPWNFPTEFEQFSTRMSLAILGSHGFFGAV